MATLSEIESSMNSCGFWNVFTTPAAAMVCGLRPWISAVFQRIRPALGARIPVIRLSSVVLPDPFGPKIPTISPAAIESETSDTAVSPPKRFVSSITSSSTAPARKRSDHPLRQDQDGQNQNQPVQDGSGLAGEVDHVRKAGQHESSGDGTYDRGPTAQEDHGDDIERLIDAQIIGLDVTGVEGVETTSNRGERIGQSEGQQLVTEYVDPEGLRQIFVEADRRETAADPGTQYQRAGSDREDQGGQAEEIPAQHAILISPVTGTQTNGLSSTISPSVPFVTLFQLRMTSRASSENASVTTAK